MYEKIEKDQVQMVEEGNKYGKAVEVGVKEDTKQNQKENDKKVDQAVHKVGKEMETTVTKKILDSNKGWD